MTRKSKIRKKLAVAISVMMLIATAIVTTALADDSVQATLSGGTLQGGDIGFANFTVTLNGKQQTKDATWSIADITDATGTGAGWNLSLKLTQLKEYDTVGNAYVEGGKSLPASSIIVKTAPAVTLADDTSSPADNITAVSASTALDTGDFVSLLSAPVNEGMGSYNISDMHVTLAVPANAFAATYQTDATVSLGTGP